MKERPTYWIDALEPRRLLSAAPVVLSVRTEPAGPQRSMVRGVAVQFSHDVGQSVQTGDLGIWNQQTGSKLDLSLASVEWDAKASTATWRFAQFPNGSLPDGDYRFVVDGMRIHDASGRVLDGGGDGVGGDDYSFTLHRLFGDADGDRDVDSADATKYLLSKSPGRAAQWRGAFDVDGNGRMDAADRAAFFANLGRQLGVGGNNAPPLAPLITEPASEGQRISGQDVHMVAAEFVDPNSGQSHDASDWEIWTTGLAPTRVWSSLNNADPIEREHIHFASGVFEGPQLGRNRLEADTQYLLRVRHHDNSGHAPTAAGQWSIRHFHTLPEETPAGVDWTVHQPGYVVEELPFIFDAAQIGNRGEFRLPTNIAFVPNPGPHPDDVLFYVGELYGAIRSVSRNFTVRTYADGLLNFNPEGGIPGVGEAGVTGLVVDPENGDVYATMVYGVNQGTEIVPYPKIVRFTSNDGGLTAVDTDPAQLGTQGTDILKFLDTSRSWEFQNYSHTISNITFGPDGKLYVHNGEGFRYQWAMPTYSFLGKVLRLNKDGTAPTDNPYYTTGDELNDGKPDAEDYVFARGFRNPFGGAWNAADGMHYSVENGPSTNDRIAKIRRGENYGWDGTDASMTTNALFNWQQTTAPVNMTFVQQETFGGSGFPMEKWGRMYVTQSGPTFAEGSGSGLKKLVEFRINTNVDGDGDPTNDNGAVIEGPTPLVSYTGAGRSTFVGLAAGPDGLYFTALYKDDPANFDGTAAGGKVLRVRYVGETWALAQHSHEEAHAHHAAMPPAMEASEIDQPIESQAAESGADALVRRRIGQWIRRVRGIVEHLKIARHQAIWTARPERGVQAVFDDERDVLIRERGGIILVQSARSRLAGASRIPIGRPAFPLRP